MSSYVGVGSNPQYVLPFQMDAVPSSMKSCLAPRPISCSLQTVNVPSTSGSATLGTTSTIQVPLGQAAYIANPYLRFRVSYLPTVDVTGLQFKGATQSAFALISGFQSSINSTLVDNIQNYAQTAELLLNHSSSREWLSADGAVIMNTTSAILGGNPTVVAGTQFETYCLPLLGLLGSQQAFPAWAVNGVLQLSINWTQTVNAAYRYTAGTFTVAISELALVYDRIAVEGDFIAKMRMDMAQSGAKYCYGFSNYQSVSQPAAIGTQQLTINTGLNVSSLRGVLMTSTVSADYTTASSLGNAISNGLSNFQLSLDGRLINANILDAVTAPAVVFIEMNKCFSRMFDSSVTDNSTKATYLANTFAAGVSCTRISEGLAFQGSPVSVVGLNLTLAPAAVSTVFLFYISDYQLLIGADGQCDLVR